ncbi:MAG: hypothetical protein K0B01_02545 [Syntrophobacterales bacterium]|nr:hypothetical protein [Syntrophobacterales bacterium]
MKSVLHDFWTWSRKRKIVDSVPEMPSITFQLGFRKTIDKETQQTIIDEVNRCSYSINPKIWIGVKWLATYISIRPGKLIRILEGDFDLKNKMVLIPDPKEKRPEYVPLLDEDIEIIKTFPPAIPSIPFFRHPKGVCGATEGEAFGPRLLYKWWKIAGTNLDIGDVDLYGGTRHSSAKALRHAFSPDQIKRATMHSTNKAFERYFSMELDDVRNIYAGTKAPDKADTNLTPKSGSTKKPNIIKLHN